MSVYEQTVVPFIKNLKNLEAWFDKAEEHAKAKSFEFDNFVNLRLAADQYPLVKQVQAACDQAKTATARLMGKEPPKHPDTEKTMSELRARIKTCLAYLESVSAADFKGAETRNVPLTFMPGKGMVGPLYATEMALPNFYFHLVTAYAIFRHAGVELGKIAYIGSLTLVDL